VSDIAEEFVLKARRGKGSNEIDWYYLSGLTNIMITAKRETAPRFARERAEEIRRVIGPRKYVLESAVPDEYRPKFAINFCKRHEYWGVSVDYVSAKGYGHGQRLTPSKCCGSMSIVKSWELSRDEWLQIAKEATEAAELLK
jgi:hypothetical protein